MDIKEIKQVVDLMKRSDLTEFEIEDKDFKLRIKRDGKTSREAGSAAPQPVPTMAQPVAMPMHPAMPPHTPPPAEGESTQPAQTPAEDADTLYIKSPMVGTFYRAPNPESPNFVEVGATVTSDSVVCIIEAMKVMNEIQAEVSGTVTKVLVENGQAVEYGQPLFKIKTA